MAKKRDVLSRMARVGLSNDCTPLLANNNWVGYMNEECSGYIKSLSSCEEDLSEDIERLRRIVLNRS